MGDVLSWLGIVISSTILMGYALQELASELIARWYLKGAAGNYGLALRALDASDLKEGRLAVKVAEIVVRRERGLGP